METDNVPVNPDSSDENFPANHGRKGIHIAADAVARAVHSLPSNQQDLILWFHGYGFENHLSYEELGALIQRDKNTVYQVFTGSHGAKKDNICAEIARFREVHNDRVGTDAAPFRETRLARKCWQTFDMARTYQKMAILTGEAQCGKTKASEVYQKKHELDTIMMSVPAGGSFGIFLEEFARALNIPSGSNQTDMRMRIKEWVRKRGSRILYIFDEADQFFLGMKKGRSVQRRVIGLEYIRELYMAAGCGVALVAAPQFRNDIEGAEVAVILLRLKRRRILNVELDDQPVRAELDGFASDYKLPPATGRALEIQTGIVRDEGLGMWLTTLRMGAGVATKAKERMTWQHVVDAHEARCELEKPVKRRDDVKKP